MIDISQANKAEVLAALYNNAAPMGMGLLRAQPNEMTTEEAQRILDEGSDVDYPMRQRGYFDHLHGRPLKVDLRGDTLHTELYDRDQGQGAAAQALADVDGVVIR